MVRWEIIVDYPDRSDVIMGVLVRGRPNEEERWQQKTDITVL